MSKQLLLQRALYQHATKDCVNLPYQNFPTPLDDIREHTHRCCPDSPAAGGSARVAGWDMGYAPGSLCCPCRLHNELYDLLAKCGHRPVRWLGMAWIALLVAYNWVALQMPLAGVTQGTVLVVGFIAVLIYALYQVELSR